MKRSAFGLYLVMLRRKYGITQIDLGAEMGCAPANLSRVAMGNARAPRHWPAAMTQALNNLGNPVKISEIQTLLEYSNRRLDLEKIDRRHGVVLAAYANNGLSEENQRKLSELLDRIAKETEVPYIGNWVPGTETRVEYVCTKRHERNNVSKKH